MANERLPNERYPDGMNRPDMSTRPGVTGAGMTGAGLTEPGLTGAEYERTARMDSRLQPDPELTEGRASGGRIAAYAVGIAILLGAVFYGLNNMSMHNDQAGNAPASQTASKTPAPNSSPGVTTGAAGDRTTPPPAPAGQNNNAK
ncbi:hypothetical protein [Bradyrhizobium sp. STM 3809]|uniref:hypothetical protein n=1 Tax=Bradyrhizobium sp. STM 3809 TaxID=551936 RepID=UPI0002405FCA|nr:hypothetical protein [Bradyrhizobium sp. STM 3809]CCD98128.1 conserved hypothetical protein [Bradyrhizobium sp. STM 3809]